MTGSGERVMLEFRSANVTHPILSVSGMSKKGIQAVLGHNFGYLQRGSNRLKLTCTGDLYCLRAQRVADEAPDCAPAMWEGRDEDGDDAPGEPGVGDETETAVATEMTSPTERSDAARRRHELSHLPFQPWCEHGVRGRTRPATSKNTRRSARRDRHSNRLLLHENEATRLPHHNTGWC